MEKDKLGIAFLVLSLVSVGFTSQSAFAGLGTTVSINDVLMVEGDGPGTTELVFTITVANFFSDTVTVDYLTVGDTATEGTDYFGGGTSFTIISDGGEDGVTTALVAIEVFGDTDFENDETFFVNLSNCSVIDCIIIDGQGIGTIVNDDEPLPDPTLYGIGFSGPDGPSQLYTIDVNTGDATPIGDGIGFERCSAMDFDSLTGTLYALCERIDDTDDDINDDVSVLITINTLTGVGTEVGRTFAEDIEDLFFNAMTDMSFRNSDNVLYAHAEGNDEIVTIDVSTGQATDLSADPVGCAGNALAFSPEDTLYLAACTELITIDQTTGDFIDSVTNMVDVNRVNGMDFDPVSGVLFGIHNEGEGGSDNSLVTIDVSDFSIMTQVPTENGMDAIAVFTSPCEPGFVFDTETEECVAPPEPEPASETAYVSAGNSDGGENLDPGAIGRANLDTGDITQVGDPVVEGPLSGLTFDSDGNLYGSGPQSRQLYQIDPITGEVILNVDITTTVVIEGSPTTLPVKIRDLATQPGTDVIFGVGERQFLFGGDSPECQSFNSLFTINPSDGSADCVGVLSVIEGSIGGLAFDSDGNLYATGIDCSEGCFDFLASFNPEDASMVEGSEIELDNGFFDGLGIRPSDGAFFGTLGCQEECFSGIYSINPDTGETNLVSGTENDQTSDITFFTFSAPPASGTGGEGYEGPTLGEFDDGRLIVSDGFCFDRFCLDVLDYFNHLPIQQVDSGTTHTISMTAYCSAGSNRCNYASVGAAPPGTDINSVDWNVMLKRTGNSNDWQVTKVDPNGMLGDVTGTVQVVDASRIQYTFNIQFITPASIGTVDGNAEPPEDNMILVTEIRDSNGGSGRNIFNEGVFVNDIYAYPQVDASYLPSVTVTPLCLNEDPTDRNTCAFELVRQWTLKQAEEKLKEIYEQNNYKAD